LVRAVKDIKPTDPRFKFGQIVVFNDETFQCFSLAMILLVRSGVFHDGLSHSVHILRGKANTMKHVSSSICGPHIKNLLCEFRSANIARMVPHPNELISDFLEAVRQSHSRVLPPTTIVHECLRAPHLPPDLPAGKCGVYVFSPCSVTTAKAGPNRTLKVGKIGANSGPRFKYQHYSSGSANSTVAGALENNKLLWGYVGVADDTTAFGEWLKENTDRDHFFVDAANADFVPLLEVYLKAVLGPVLEGSLKKHSVTAGE
jgi:hypothetical protein